ncbi:MAG: glycosyltransferase family 1 protein [Ilumatobacteraceae bacterium]
MSADLDAPRLMVAFDASPLLSPLTGVGVAVQQMVRTLEQREDVELARYACSFRGALQPGMKRLPLPAAVAQRLWGTMAHPRVDHWLRPARVVHGTNYTVPPSRLPRLVSVYDCWFLRHPEQATRSVAHTAKVLRRAVASGAAVHASSQATADAVSEILATDRVHVIALAAAPAADLSAMPADRPAPVAELAGVPFVLALGTLERRKNLPRLIQAFGKIASDHPELRLVLAGADGDDRPAIDSAIDVLDASARRRVMLTGRIEPSAKHWLLANAAVLAYPSLDEGFGFPLLEAMQHRVPIVASTAGSIPEVAGAAAFMVDAADTDALAGALHGVVSDEAQQARLVAAGDARLACFSWDETGRCLAALYRRLASEGT